MKLCTEVNESRYEMFCSKKGKIESSQLPPCQHSLRKHIDRANYQALIWRKCSEQYPDIPEPEDHGWKYENNQLAIDWMTILPAPDSILEFLSCGCIKSCDNNRCTCRSNGIPCTDMCKLKNCSNAAIIESDDEDREEDREEDYDSEISDDDSSDDE